MSHRLQTELQGRLASVLAGDFLTPESQVELMASVAIGTVIDGLIADAVGDNDCALELSCDTGSFGGGSEYLGTLPNWLRKQKEVLAS